MLSEKKYGEYEQVNGAVVNRLQDELATANEQIMELEGIIAGVASYLEGDPTFTDTDKVLDEVDKIAREYYRVKK